MYNPPDLNLSGYVVPMSVGRAGVQQTLKAMRRLVNESKKDLQIRSIALNCVYLHPQKIDCLECEQIYLFVRDNIRYVKDVLDVETLASPITTLEIRQGDCDDKTCLLAAMLESIGYLTRFIIAGYSDTQNYEHVYLQVFCDGQWIDCDTTENYYFGWCPPDPLIIAAEKV